MARAFSGSNGLGWSSVWIYRSAATAYPAQTVVEDELRVRSAKVYYAQSIMQTNHMRADSVRGEMHDPHASIVGQGKYAGLRVSRVVL